MRHHLGLKGFLCKHCNKEFKKADTFNVHMEAKHYDASKGKPEYICDFDGCGKKYARKVWIRIDIPLPKQIFIYFFIHIQESLRVHIQFVHIGRERVFSQKVIFLSELKLLIDSIINVYFMLSNADMRAVWKNI